MKNLYASFDTVESAGNKCGASTGRVIKTVWKLIKGFFHLAVFGTVVFIGAFIKSMVKA